MKFKFISLKLIVIAIVSLAGFCRPMIAKEPARHTFAIGTNDFLLDGQRFQIRCGEIHAARVPAEYWRHRLQMAKAMGLNTVCAYLFWNQIEPRPGQFTWSDQANVAEFCRIAQKEGLWVILRPGPYSCAEWEMGGFPWWLLKNGDIKLRTRDPRYLEAVKKYLHEVGTCVRSIADHSRRADSHGAGGKRIWFLRQRRGIHGRIAENNN
ncbi:MAG: beta-galactosidase [Limisphaerales bacterium]